MLHVQKKKVERRPLQENRPPLSNLLAQVEKRSLKRKAKEFKEQIVELFSVVL